MVREMTDSRVDWIGDIPSNWKIVRTKNFFANHKMIAGEKSSEYERLALTLNGVVKRSKDDSTGLQPEAFDGYQVLNPGELVFKLIDLENLQTSRVGLSPYCGIVSPAYIVLKPNENVVLPKYAELYFLSMWHRAIFNHIGDDGVRSSLGPDDLLNIPFSLPPMDEQEKIAHYLNKKCNIIDKITADTAKSIEEYKTLKQSIVYDVLTNGLDPTTQKKKTGVFWLSEMPHNWNFLKVSRLFSIGRGRVIAKTELKEDGSFPVYSSQTKNDGILGYIDTYDFEKDQLTWTTDGANAGTVFLRRGKHNCTNVCGTLTPTNDRHDLRFLKYALEFGAIYHKRADINGYKIMNNEMAAIKIPVPESKTEQIKIADYLDDRTSFIDNMIQKKEQLLEDIKDYKKSIIYEYVTGKKEVPEL